MTLMTPTCSSLTSSPVRTPQLHDYEPKADNFLADVIDGLSQPRKRLSCKYFYDLAGSTLFDQICELPEYYPTRTELSITEKYADDIAEAVGPGALLVEYGSGTSTKTCILLDHLRHPTGYVPIDISRGHLLRSARQLQRLYPQLHIAPVCADYTAPFELPTLATPAESVVAYFPGSTIGNFEPAEALAFLQNIRRLCGPGSSLLIGVDLKKDPAKLHAAYNDAAGVTAEFNLNILKRINRELGGTFDEAGFAHYAPFNPTLGRMEMHLVSLRQQQVTVGGRTFAFETGESIHTESCLKYTLGQFESLAADAGYTRRQVWTDESALFSVQLFDVAE